MNIAIVIYLSVVVFMSIVCFVAYGLDKRRAANSYRRVPERTLHMLAFVGGWPGAMAGQRLFRHKTNKLSFLIVFWMVVIFHVAIVGTVVYVCFGLPSNDQMAPQKAIKAGLSNAYSRTTNAEQMQPSVNSVVD